MKWSVRTLDEVADFVLGKMLDQEKNKGDLLPYLANVNVRWGEFDLDNLRNMRFEENEIERFSLKYGDIVMCEGGEPGRCSIWKSHQEGMMFQKALHRIRPHECIDSRYLYYAFLHHGKIGGFAPYITGSTIKHLPREQLAKVEVRYPELPAQKTIASVLENYDDLIETNRRRIALLEESARLLYREWFVNLRFPGHEQAKAIDVQPVGWSRKTIAEMASMLNRGITPKYDDAAPGLVINQKCIRDGRLSLALARNQSKEVKADRLVQVGDILINSTGAGTLGRVAQVRAPIPDCTVDTHVTIVRPLDPDYVGFLGVALLEMEPVFSTMGVGSTNQTELGRADIGALSLTLPPQNLCKEFHDRIWPIFMQVETLSQANSCLAQAREELLPKLMSGAIQV